MDTFRFAGSILLATSFVIVAFAQPFILLSFSITHSLLISGLWLALGCAVGPCIGHYIKEIGKEFDDE
jgi:hypothetical protein